MFRNAFGPISKEAGSFRTSLLLWLAVLLLFAAGVEAS